MREKTHRLLRNFYQGFVSVAFTLVLKHPSFRFDSLETVKAFTEILEEAAVNEKCRVPVYCFMPDHQHLILEGTDSGSDVWKVIVKYKQKTGYRACRTLGGTIWQKDFYDHIIRKDENLVTQIRYILDNPVRKGVVQSWQEYPYKGSVGYRLEDVVGSV